MVKIGREKENISKNRRGGGSEETLNKGKMPMQKERYYFNQPKGKIRGKTPKWQKAIDR